MNTNTNVGNSNIDEKKDDEKDEQIGVHIQLADFVDSLPIRPLQEVLNEFDKISSTKVCGNVVLVLGPIGSGKTTTMKALSKLSDKFVAIDGDDLGIGMDRTMNLKLERNPYSLWKIIEVLMQGKIPVMSAGGGIFFSQKNCQFVLRETIFNVLNMNINLTVLFPTNDNSSVSTIDNNDLFKKSLRRVYDDSDMVKNVVSFVILNEIC